MKTFYVTENNKFELFATEAAHPMVMELMGSDAKNHGKSYIIASKTTHNPIAVALVDENGFSIASSDMKTVITCSTCLENFDPKSILETFSALH